MERLANYVEEYLDEKLDTIQVALKVIEITRERLKPIEHLLKAVESFAQTPGMPPRAVDGFLPSLREVIDGAELDYHNIRKHALLTLGRSYLEPSPDGLKPIGYVKKDYKWVEA